MKKIIASLFATVLVLSSAIGASADFGERNVVSPKQPPVVTYDFGERN
ncbi:hypothetical protein POF51_22340 [Brevibacillus sp. AG]|nr:hypothetical protein [Brevibacillus sp. AG]MDC0763468.1 hypothetical protein [Brevibacillus sp. AG]